MKTLSFLLVSLISHLAWATIDLGPLRLSDDQGHTWSTSSYQLSDLGINGVKLQQCLDFIESHGEFGKQFFSIRSAVIGETPKNIHLEIPTKNSSGRLTIYFFYSDGQLRYMELAKKDLQFNSPEHLVATEIEPDPQWSDLVLVITEENLAANDLNNDNVNILLTQSDLRVGFDEDKVKPDNLFNTTRLILQLIYSDGSIVERNTWEIARRLQKAQHSFMIYLQNRLTSEPSAN